MMALWSEICAKQRGWCSLKEGYLLAIALNLSGISVIVAAIIALILKAQISLT
ncbi:MAG: hypothetical protein RIC29_16365 [Rhodospirillaceae bacterium]